MTPAARLATLLSSVLLSVTKTNAQTTTPPAEVYTRRISVTNLFSDSTAHQASASTTISLNSPTPSAGKQRPPTTV